jgi:hypothetical protein
VPKLKVRYAEKKTYIDEIMRQEKKEKRPAPGQYHTFKSLKEMDAERKRLAVKKLHYQDKINFLDDLQFQSTQYPGAGNYNPRVESPLSRIESRLSIRRSSPSLRIGERSTKTSRRRSRQSTPLWLPILPFPPTARFSSTWRNRRRRRAGWGRFNASRLPPQGQDCLLRSTA